MERIPGHLVSIVLPTYNGERYLAQSIESCIAQTYPHWELIIVDDASTDSTPEIIARYVTADSRIRSVRHETNRRLPAALNTGFALAQGEYLTWTSDDNIYRPYALERMVGFLRDHPEIGLIYTDYSYMDEAGNELRRRVVKQPERLVFGCIIGPCFLYHRAVYEKLGAYAEELFLAEDYDYWLRTAQHFRMAPLHENLYCYRGHDEQLGARYTNQVAESALLAQERSVPHLRWVSRNTRAEALLHMAITAKTLRKNFAMVRYLLMAFTNSPYLGLRAARYLSKALTQRQR